MVGYAHDFWGLVEWFFSMPYLASVLFGLVGSLAIFIGTLNLLRRV